MQRFFRGGGFDRGQWRVFPRGIGGRWRMLMLKTQDLSELLMMIFQKVKRPQGLLRGEKCQYSPLSFFS